VDQAKFISANFPGLPLELVGPFLPQLPGLAGRIEGQVEGNGTWESPRWNGQLTLRHGAIGLPARPVELQFSHVEANFKAQGSAVLLEHCQGLLNGGEFLAEGCLIFETWPGWQLEALIQGRHVRLWNDRSARCNADGEFRLEGGEGAGRITGEARLLGGRILRPLELTPTPLLRIAAPPLRLEPHGFEKNIPPALRSWELDVRVRNGSPFLLAGQRPPGEIQTDLRLTGTLAQPVPEGVLEFRNAVLVLPLTTASVALGRIEFSQETPWVPQADLRGTAEMPGYKIDFRACGALPQGRLLLRSEPPLPAAHLLSLLTTGYVPGRFDSAAAAKPRVARGYPHWVSALGLPVQGLSQGNAMQTSSPVFPASPTGLGGRVRLWEQMLAGDGLQDASFYPVQAGYVLRLR